MLAAVCYPPRCPVCDGLLWVDERICGAECRNKLPEIDGPRCLRCSRPIENDEAEYCYDCERRQFHCERGYAIWRYDKVMSESIARFKYKGRREYAAFYSEELLRLAGDYIRRYAPEVFVPVPLHRKRMAARGYNQAELIAVRLERATGIPSIRLLRRIRNTLPQKELNDKDRMKNVGAAFALNERRLQSLGGIPDSVMLIDDIYTTGSTLEACAQVLKDAGVQRVLFLTLCIGRGF